MRSICFTAACDQGSLTLRLGFGFWGWVRARAGIGGLVEYKLFVGSLNKNLVEKEIEDVSF